MGTKKNSNSVSDGVVITERVAPAIPEENVKTANGFIFEDKDIPKRAGKKGSLHYPIDQLEPGSTRSFLAPIEGEVTAIKLKALTASIRTYAYRHKFKVTLRSEEKGVRVWRDKAVPVTPGVTV